MFDQPSPTSVYIVPVAFIAEVFDDFVGI